MLATECATRRRHDHPDIFFPQVTSSSDLSTNGKGGLGSGPNGEPTVIPDS
jgi:hypothetical protein